MIRETFPVGALQCNCTLLGDETSHEAIVIDPGDDIPHILALLKKHSLTVKQIVITHAHIDHIAGAQQLKALTGAPILYNQQDLPLVAIMDIQAGWLGLTSIPDVRPPDSDLADGQTVAVKGLAGTVIHTPGSASISPSKISSSQVTPYSPAASAAPTSPAATDPPSSAPSSTASWSFRRRPSSSPATVPPPRSAANATKIHSSKPARAKSDASSEKIPTHNFYTPTSAPTFDLTTARSQMRISNSLISNKILS
jgi:ribonuclease BN (tRNA processing enzyme)